MTWLTMFQWMLMSGTNMPFYISRWGAQVEVVLLVDSLEVADWPL